MGVDGKKGIFAVLLGFLLSLCIGCSLIFAISRFTGMCFWHVLLINIIVGTASSSKRIKSSGIRCMLLTTALCSLSNFSWRETTSIRAVRGFGTLDHAIEVIGPVNAVATVTLHQDQKPMREGKPFALTGLWEPYRVPILPSDNEQPWEACVAFHRTPFSIFRHTKCVFSPSIKLPRLNEEKRGRKSD